MQSCQLGEEREKETNGCGTRRGVEMRQKIVISVA
jgi:hypothetical protein